MWMENDAFHRQKWKIVQRCITLRCRDAYGVVWCVNAEPMFNDEVHAQQNLLWHWHSVHEVESVIDGYSIYVKCKASRTVNLHDTT